MSDLIKEPRPEDFLQVAVACLLMISFGLGVLAGSKNPEMFFGSTPKNGVTILYLAEPGAIHILVEPKEDIATMQALEIHLKKFPFAKIKGPVIGLK